MDVWNILWISGMFYYKSVYFVLIWYIFSSFGIMHQENSGNPGFPDKRGTKNRLPEKRLSAKGAQPLQPKL
jgi:hypothetical protein